MKMKEISLQEAVELIELMKLEGYDCYFKRSINGNITVMTDFIEMKGGDERK